MSMIGNFVRVTPQQLDSFLADSSLLENHIYDDDVEGLLDIDKNWDILNYTITGYKLVDSDKASAPLKYVIFGGQTIDDAQDLGCGPAQYLPAAQVQEVSAALDAISIDEFKKRYVAAANDSEGVYPEVWTDDDETAQIVAEEFELLKAFYAEAARNGMAVVGWLT